MVAEDEAPDSSASGAAPAPAGASPASPALSLAKALTKIGVSAPPTAPSGPVAAYVEREMRGVLQLAGLTRLEGGLKEADLFDVEVLASACNGHLIGTDEDEATQAFKQVVRVLRATSWGVSVPAAERIGFVELRALRRPLQAAAATTMVNRMRVVQEAAAGGSPARPSAVGLSSPRTGTGTPERMKSLESMLQTAVQALASASSRRPGDREGAEAKMPPARTVLERATMWACAQLGHLPPPALMPIEEDVYRAFAQLTSTPPRVAALDTLELPLGGRSTDHRAARPKSFAHPRGQSVDDEMSLLDRWLFTHAFAGSVPAGPQYVITEVDEGTAVAVDPEDPVASYCRPDLAASPPADDEADAEDEADAPTAVPIAAIVRVMLYGMHCRLEAKLGGLKAGDARAFADDVRADVDSYLFQDRHTFTTALDLTSPHALARRYSRSSHAGNSGGGAAGASGGSPAARDRDKGSPGGGGATKRAAPAPAADDQPKVCFKWLRGSCAEGDDCTFRHSLSNAEAKNASGTGGAGKRRRGGKGK